MELPDRKATYWTTQTAYETEARCGFFPEDIAIVHVRTEVPQDEAGPVRRLGNRWYQTTVHIEGPDIDLMMSPEDAKALGHAILCAADVCAATDDADADVCGHWAPCDCGGKR